jgi:hypothetical protein
MIVEFLSQARSAWMLSRTRSVRKPASWLAATPPRVPSGRPFISFSFGANDTGTLPLAFSHCEVSRIRQMLHVFPVAITSFTDEDEQLILWCSDNGHTH